MPEKFSILTCCYNGASYIEDWSRSILAQKYRPLEVVVVDDFSTDASLSLLEKQIPIFAKHNIELKVVQNHERLYCGTSSRHAWSNATGNFFGILDIDDMLVNDAVEYIMRLYQQFPKITYIYTQFSMCSADMLKKKRGFSTSPKRGQCLLDLGLKHKHGLSHWRTFSNRCPRPDKLFKDGLRSAIDKFFEYRLEELGPGMFTDRVCYLYRWGHKNTISKTEKATKQWRAIVREAEKRRAKYNLTPFPLITHKEK